MEAVEPKELAVYLEAVVVELAALQRELPLL